MDDLRTLTSGQLIERNQALGEQKDRIMDARRQINAELDRRADVDRLARTVVALPLEHRVNVLAESDPEVAQRVIELDAQLPQRPPAQTIEPTGTESEEASGIPGEDKPRRRRKW